MGAQPILHASCDLTDMRLVFTCVCSRRLSHVPQLIALKLSHQCAMPMLFTKRAYVRASRAIWAKEWVTTAALALAMRCELLEGPLRRSVMVGWKAPPASSQAKLVPTTPPTSLMSCTKSSTHALEMKAKPAMHGTLARPPPPSSLPRVVWS